MAENCHQGERGMLDYAHIQKLYIVRKIDKLSMAELSKLSMAEYKMSFLPSARSCRPDSSPEFRL